MATSNGTDERENRARREREERDSEFIDKLVHINRVAKVVKGGRRFGFAALVVVGDQKGRVGFGHGKAREVPEAIRKATEAAKRSLDPRSAARRPHAASRRRTAVTAPARCSCARRLPAPASSPVVRCAPCSKRSACRTSVAKSLGSSNPYNMVRATFDALKHQDWPRSVAARRNLKVSALQARRRRSTPKRRRLIAAREELRVMAKACNEDHHGRADRQPDPPRGHPARDADRPRPEQDGPHAGARWTRRSAAA